MAIIISKSARLYRERKGRIPTLRSPRARLRPKSMRINTFPLNFPLPDPTTVTDAGPGGPETTVWHAGTTLDQAT